MSKTSISVNKYVRDAFYSIPDFTNGDGNHIGGVYGAMFKLVSLLKTGESDEVELITETSDGSASSDLEIQDTPFVKWQIDFFLSELKNVLAGNITDTDNGFSFTVSDDLVNALSEKLSELSPNGQVKAVPVFSLKMRQTSDLNEVEEIFKNAY